MSEAEQCDSPTFLQSNYIERKMGVNARSARALKDAFVTKEQLVEALESGEDLEEVDGVGPKTRSAVWDWYRNIYNGEVEADGTLVLDDEGLHLPEWLHGFTGTFTVNTPSITMRPTTTDEGLGEVSDILGVYPEDGEWNDRLEEGMIALSAPLHGEEIYEIDDQRTEKFEERDENGE